MLPFENRGAAGRIYFGDDVLLLRGIGASGLNVIRDTGIIEYLFRSTQRIAD